MRVGANPLKGKEHVKKQRSVTVAVLNFIPFQSGYFHQGLSILQLCLESIRRNTQTPFDLLLFDNGSAEPVVEYLFNEKNRGNLDYLILSDGNVGKVGAWNIMLRAAPGDYVAYSDGDVFFYPGWLEQHMRIFEAFPSAGMVTGMPMRHVVNRYTDNTLRLAKADDSIREEKGDLISREFREFFCKGVGLEYDRYMAEYGHLEDIRLTRKDEQAYVGSSHFQFIMRREVIDQVLPQTVNLPLHKSDDRKFDQAVDCAGYMRLSLTAPYVQHLGNNLAGEWQQVARGFGINGNVKNQRILSRKGNFTSRIWEFPLLKKILLRVYDEIFNIYYRK